MRSINCGSLLFKRPYTKLAQQKVVRLVQFNSPTSPSVGVVSQNDVIDITSVIPEAKSVYELFFTALSQNLTIKGFLKKHQSKLNFANNYVYKQLLRSGHMLPSFNHPDPMRCFVTGTGLTHLGSTQARDEMHKKDKGIKTDSQKMFDMGVEGGKPPKGQIGVQPEWFYKGNGTILRSHGQFLTIPYFTEDGGEEPEISVCYITTPNREIHRIGYTICNEWSDHPMEKVNYLWLAPSKLRQCAIGPELLLMEHFDNHTGYCKITRDNSEIYNSGELLTGENHMSHSLENMEYHHFKHEIFNSPLISCVHTLGTSKISFSSKRSPLQDNDLIEIGFEGFGEPLVNPVLREPKPSKPFQIKHSQHLFNYEE